MNRLLIYKNEQYDPNDKSIFRITDSIRVSHFNNIINAQKNDSVKITYLDHGICDGEIISITKSELIVKIFKISPVLQTHINFLIGISRPPTIKKILEHGTTMGAQSYHFYQAKLSDKNYLKSKVFDKDNIKSLLTLGLSQSGVYTSIPKVCTDKSYPDKIIDNYSQKFVLSLKRNKSLFDYTKNIDWHGTLLFAIGPERGFTDEEEDHFIQNGFLPVSMGPSILRVEHAVYSVLAQVNLLKTQVRPL